jgi:hypothetical protein
VITVVSRDVCMGVAIRQSLVFRILGYFGLRRRNRDFLDGGRQVDREGRARD